MTTTNWRDQAACLGQDTERFYPVGSTGRAVEQAEEAKAICQAYPVATQCLEWALENNQHDDIWGGKTEDERRSLRRARQRAQRSRD